MCYEQRNGSSNLYRGPPTKIPRKNSHQRLHLMVIELKISSIANMFSISSKFSGQNLQMPKKRVLNKDTKYLIKRKKSFKA